MKLKLRLYQPKLSTEEKKSFLVLKNKAFFEYDLVKPS